MKNSAKSTKKLEKMKKNQEKMNAYANMKTKNIQSKATNTSTLSEKEKEEAMKKARENYNNGNAKPGSMMSENWQWC